MAAEASSVVDLRNRGFHEEADEIERIVEEKIKKINNAVDKFYNGLSQMSPEETVEFFTNVLTFPFTPEGLVYRGLGNATRSALRTTTRTAPTTTTRTVPTTTTRTVPTTTTRTVPTTTTKMVSKKATGPTSDQPLRRSPRIAEKRKFAGAEQAGSGAKKFTPRSLDQLGTRDRLGERKGKLNKANLTGKNFEEYLVKKLGGRGSFKARSASSSREFDGVVGNVWYEAKSGKYWDMILSSKEKLANFKSDIGRGLNVAKANNVYYELHSNTSIPKEIKDWLIKKGIKFTEWS